MITLALSKGRIFDETLPLLAAAGIEVLEDPEKSRKLILPTNLPNVRVVLVRATDVPTYVEYGGADLGVTGKDTLIEHGGQGLYQPLDLRIAKCRVSVAVRNDFDYAQAVKKGSRLKVATKYTSIARDFFARNVRKANGGPWSKFDVRHGKKRQNSSQVRSAYKWAAEQLAKNGTLRGVAVPVELWPDDCATPGVRVPF